MTTLRPLMKNIIFQFEDELATANGVKQFRESTSWGFDLRSNFDHNTKAPRWGIVIAFGPEVSEEIKVGMAVLIEPLKWTEGVQYEGQHYWMTNEDQILAVREG